MTDGETRTNKSSPSRLWWAVTGILALAVLTAAVLLFLREPDTRIVDVQSDQVAPLSPEIVAEMARLEQEAEDLSAEARDLLTQVIAYECPPGSEPKDLAALQAMQDRARAMLGER